MFVNAYIERIIDMAFERYACYVHAGNERFSIETTSIEEATRWCCETFDKMFDTNRFVNAYCIYIDTEYGPVYFPFGFHRDDSKVVDDNNAAWCFVFEDTTSGEKLVTVDQLIEWVLLDSVM